MKNPYIIAEIASAHEGRPDLAIDIAKYAVDAGCDAVKFQIFNRNQLLTKNNPQFNEFGEIEIKSDKWKDIINEVSNKKIDIIIEPYDVESLKIAAQTELIKSYKLPTACIGDTELMEKMKETKKSVYIGVGGAKWNEIKRAVSVFKKSKVTLLCGFQNFPTKLEDSKLFQILKLKTAFGCAVGYADHVDAEDKKMAQLMPALAFVAGATVIEKHITDDRSRKGRDYYSALNPDEFKSFVCLMRHLPDIIGVENEWCLSEAELQYRKFTKRYAVAARDIAIGKELDLKDIVFKRTNDEGLSAQDISEYAGREIVRSKKTDDPLTREDFIES